MKPIDGRAAAVAALVAVCLMLAGSAFAATNPTAPPPEGFATLSGHVLPALARAVPVVAERRVQAESVEATLALTLVLRRTDPAGFQAYLHDVYDPASPIFRKFLTPTAVTERYGPSQDDYDAVRNYFEAQGLTLGEGSSNRLTLTFNGTRNAAANALGVDIGDYRIGDKRFYANDREPSLPESIATRVEAIAGLNSLAVPQPGVNAILSVFCGWYADANAQDLAKDANGNAVYTTNPARRLKYFNKCMYEHHANGYSKPSDYPDPPPPAWQGVDGSGQTVGLVAFDTFAPSDVTDYIAALGLPAGKIADVTQLHVNGGATTGANQDEVLLDIDTVLMTAPGAKIVVFDAPFAAGGTFQAVFNAMISAGVDIISNSWAYCEDQTTLADVQSIDTILQTAAASGISAFSGTGDHGSTCLDGRPNTVHVPSDSPHVTAVGGTSFKLGPGFTYQSETWWDGTADSPPTGQGGFGVSTFFPRPAYQDGTGVSSMRSVPDVASNADPAEGALICQASAGGCPSGLLYGGTSRSAPSWAAFAALLNQAQGSKLGFLNPLLYPLAATDSFHSASSMGTDFAHVGLGSPNLARLHQALTAQTTGAVDLAVSQVLAFSANSTSWVPNVDSVPLPIQADGTSPTYVVVRLADGKGNIIQGQTVTLAAPGSGAVISPASGVSSVANGAVVFKVTDLAFESVTFIATVMQGNLVLPQQPTVLFIPPVATGASIGASPTPVASDGVSTTTITVTLQDGLGRPSPGKQIAIAQGGGHSIITGPNPPVTDAAGKIQFTASDGISETVVYTAVDMNDGELPVPGSATVVFTGGSTSCVAAPPVAGSGLTLTPWATGFFAQDFFFGNVNWGGCPGASNPTFTSSGTALVADFRTGDLFSFGLEGGASAGHTLSNLSQTLGQPTFGKDGRLYATHGATTGNFFTGDIVEINPTTGAQLRVVAANLTCPNGLSVDPLSGDLFFDDECFGAGSDNPSIWRIHDPAGTATLSVYATLPATPNGQLAFSPDGTLYAVTGYNGVQQVIRIGGTNTVSPPSMTTLSGISSFFCLTMGEAQGNGAAKSLIVCDSNGIELVDITTNPFTSAVLMSGGSASSGVAGPDGCLYTAAQDTIYKLTKGDGSCGFVPTNPGPALVLTPAVVTPNPAQGGTQTFTATFKNTSVPAGTPVIFTVAGANLQFKLATTDATGAASATYVGALAGVDTVRATSTTGGLDLTSSPVQVTWGPGKDRSFLDISASPAGSLAGDTVTVRASLFDVSVNPAAPIPGASIHFTLGLQSCNGTTDASGIASCGLAASTAGQFVLMASYAGSAAYTAASASQNFGVVAAAGSPPSAPTIGSAAPGDERITVTFAPPANDGGSAIASYTVTCTPVGGGTPVSATGSGSPITVFGLTEGVTYTCTVSATNSSGPGASSAASNPATPAGRPVIVQQPIPTLTRWGELVLMGLLALLAGVALRRRRRDSGS